MNLDRRELRILAETAKDNEDRILPISARLLAVMEMARHDPAGNVLGPQAYVFGSATGERTTSLKTAWRTVCRKTQIYDLRFHDLRHEAGSRFLEAGWPLHHVQHMLGHARHQDHKHLPQCHAAKLASINARIGQIQPGLHKSCKNPFYHSPTSSQQDLPETTQPADQLADKVGTPDRIRTCDPRLRRPMLYPAELRAHGGHDDCIVSQSFSQAHIPRLRIRLDSPLAQGYAPLRFNKGDHTPTRLWTDVCRIRVRLKGE